MPGGRRSYDANPDARPSGGGWVGPVFVLTHHPHDAAPRPDVTFSSGDIGDAVAQGRDVQLLGAGIRGFDRPGVEPLRWERIHAGDSPRVVDVRYRPAR